MNSSSKRVLVGFLPCGSWKDTFQPASSGRGGNDAHPHSMSPWSEWHEFVQRGASGEGPGEVFSGRSLSPRGGYDTQLESQHCCPLKLVLAPPLSPMAHHRCFLQRTLSSVAVRVETSTFRFTLCGTSHNLAHNYLFSGPQHTPLKKALREMFSKVSFALIFNKLIRTLEFYPALCFHSSSKRHVRTGFFLTQRNNIVVGISGSSQK